MGKIYYSAQDVAEMLGISKSRAYKLVHMLNSELNVKGYIVLQGKVPVAYFNERWYGLSTKEGGAVQGA